MKIIHLVIALIAFTTTAFAEDDFSKEVVKPTKLTDTLYMLEGAGGNITASIGADGVLLVDCDFAEMSEKLVTKLKELKGDSPRFIINTHFHYDHTGGNEIFGSAATIIAAREVRDRLATEQTLWGKTHPPLSHKALPTLTFDQSISLHLNQNEIRVVHYPHGHTDGDSVVFFDGGKIVSMGDLYFSGMYPIFHPEHKGSLHGYLRNLKRILRALPEDAKVIPGHGDLTGKAGLESYVKMIELSIATVNSGIQRGESLEQIQKNGLPKELEPFSHGYRNTDQWIRAVYEEIASTRFPR